MRRVTRPVGLALLAIAIAAAVVGGTLGGGGGEDRSLGPRAASIDTGAVSLEGAGRLAEEERTRPRERLRDVVKPDPPVSMDPAGPDEVVGQVVDPEGNPVVAKVVLFVDGWAYGPGPSATTDGRGRFRLKRTRADGTVWTGVVALLRPFGFTAPPSPVRGGEAALRIVASPARTARITVVDEDGKGVGIARVGIGGRPAAGTPDDARPWRERTDEIASWYARHAYADRAGTALVRQLPVPTAVLTAEAPLDRDLLPATFVGWDGGDATIRLTAKPRVEGTVRESGASLLTDGTVAWRRVGTEAWTYVRVQYDGTFTIDCGEPGAIELCPRMYNAFPRPPVAESVVPSGTTNVALLAEAGPTLDVRLGGWIEDARGTAELIREPAEALDVPRMPVAIDDGRVLVRGLDADAKYTLWVPPLARVSAGPMPIEPDTLCALRTGLSASGDPVPVPLTPVHEVRARFASTGQEFGWRGVRVVVRGHGLRLEFPFGGSWQYDEHSYDGEAVLRLPPGPFLVRIEAYQNVSTPAQRETGRFLIRRYAGEAVWETGVERIDVPMAPTSDGPEEREDD